MRRIVVSEFVSLDGVMQAPGGREEDASGSFKHGGWSFKFRDDQVPKYKLDELAASDALLLHDLVDELRLMVHPVVLGSGRRLFDDHAEMLKPLKLAESKTFPSGIVLLSYHQAK